MICIQYDYNSCTVKKYDDNETKHHQITYPLHIPLMSNSETKHMCHVSHDLLKYREITRIEITITSKYQSSKYRLWNSSTNIALELIELRTYKYEAWHDPDPWFMKLSATSSTSKPISNNDVSTIHRYDIVMTMYVAMVTFNKKEKRSSIVPQTNQQNYNFTTLSTLFPLMKETGTVTQ